MKILSAVAALFLLTAGAASAALPVCASNFCAGAANGANCQISGKIHTCGKCTGTPNGVLYIGDLSAADAEAKCKVHVNKDTRTVNSTVVEAVVAPTKTPTKSTAVTR